MNLIYQAGEVATQAFILEKGAITFHLSSGETFGVKDANVIFGVSELLALWGNETTGLRVLSAEAGEGTSVKPVPAANLKQHIQHYNVGFNIAREVAHELRECNRILQTELNSLSARQRRSQEYAKAVADVVDALQVVFAEKRFPLLKTIHDEFAHTLTYKYGLGFRKLASKTVMAMDRGQLGDLVRTYPAGSYVCRQGDEGDELYILEAGTLGIYVGESEQPVVLITQPGEVIGEMCLLLNDSRSATIKAEDAAQLSVVRKENLKQVATAQPDFFLEIGTTLSRRMHQSVNFLQQLKAEKIANARPDCLVDDPHRDCFALLEKRVSEAFREKGLPAFKDLHDMMRKIRISIA